jgi:hypothetical protein
VVTVCWARMCVRRLTYQLYRNFLETAFGAAEDGVSSCEGVSVSNTPELQRALGRGPSCVSARHIRDDGLGVEDL